MLPVPQVLEPDPRDRRRDERLDDRRRCVNTTEHDQRQRHGVRRRERGERDHQFAHGARRQEQARQEHQMVVAGQDVADAQLEEMPCGAEAADGAASRSMVAAPDSASSSLCSPRVIQADDHELAMAACHPLRHVGGDGEAPDPTARKAESQTTTAPARRRRRSRRRRSRLNGFAVDRQANGVARKLAQCDAVGLRPGASAATSAAAIESDTETALSSTLTSRELRPGSCARSTALAEREPDERD